LVAAAVLFAVAVRIRLLGIPLERDEGEYAYTGQLMLQGIPPYKLVYSMKFPGAAAAYAAIMSVFGQTITGIHLGFMLVNAGAIVLIYLLGKRLFTPAAGVAASAAYALLSIGQGVNGTQAHATHFVVLAALGGTLLLLRGIDSRRWSTLLLSGLLFGVAILMKQHGALFAVFGVFYLAWDQFARRRDGWLPAVKSLATFLCGMLLPLVLTGLALWWAGVFDKFWFWTFTYAHKYTQELRLSVGFKLFRENFHDAVGPNLAIWLIALAGLVLIWWRKENRAGAVFASGLLLFSFLAICPGLYFRGHYFVLMLPAISLLAGAAVSTARKLWPRLSWMPYGVYFAALVFSVVQQQDYLFQMSPLQITRAMYGGSPFPEAIEIANYIQTHTSKDSRIAILGSEPEILFYANRHSATGHIYMYGLMEAQPYALTMQDEFIRDVEASRPDYIVFTTYQTSWLQSFSISSLKILQWWATYQPQRYKQLVGVADIISADHTEYRWGDIGTYHIQAASSVLVYKRSDQPDSTTARLNQTDVLPAQKKLDDAAQENLQMMTIVLEPDNYIAFNNLGDVLDKESLKQGAVDAFRRSLAIKPDQAIVHSKIGRVLTETHQFPKAIGEFTQAVRLDPANANAHNDLGVALFQFGDYEKAAGEFSDAVRIDPVFALARKNLGLAQAQLKNKKVDSGRK
jgi:tetratricopeptide (TPR) repeat protein